MVDPLGPLLLNWDAAISGGQNLIVTTIQNNMELPATTAAILFYAFQGFELANGNPAPLNNFVPQLLRVLLVLWLTTNIADYDYYVHQMFYVGLPNKLVAVAASAGGTTATAGNLADVNATSAVFSQIWNQMWVAIGMAWAHAGPLEMVGVLIAGALTAIMGGLGLLILALVFLCSHILLAVMDDITPFIIVFAMFKTTMPIFERAAGKAFALILLQFVGVIVLQIILSADQIFMQQIVNSATGTPQGVLAAITNFFSVPFGPASPLDTTMASDMQALVSIVVMFIAGAFAMLSISAIAYSIGTGISVSATSMIVGAAVTANMVSSVTNAVSNIVSTAGSGGGGAAPNYQVAMPGGGSSSLPSASPPPALSSSTRPSGEFRPA